MLDFSGPPLPNVTGTVSYLGSQPLPQELRDGTESPFQSPPFSAEVILHQQPSGSPFAMLKGLDISVLCAQDAPGIANAAEGKLVPDEMKIRERIQCALFSFPMYILTPA